MAQYCINPPKMRFLIKLWWPLVTASECWSREQYEFGKNLLIPWWYHINKVYVWLICRDPYWFPPHGNPTDQNSIIKTIKVRGEAVGRRVWLALIVMVRCCFWLKSFCWNDGCDQFIVIQSLIFFHRRFSIGNTTFHLVIGCEWALQPLDKRSTLRLVFFLMMFLSFYELHGGFCSLF